MDKSFVTETPGELLINAERDVTSLKVLLSKKYYPEDFMHAPICFHATMAVEKFLKSYIIINGKIIEKTHDLLYLLKAATKINISFEEIKNDCSLLNKFVPKIKYGEEIPITKQDMNIIIRSLENICDFPPIKTIRDAFSQKHKFKIIDETTDASS